MASAPVELDFFGIEKQTSKACPKHQFQKMLDRERSFQDIHDVISKINPENEMLTSAISTNSLKRKSPSSMESFDSKRSFSVPSTPRRDRCNLLRFLPLYAPPLKSKDPAKSNFPLTIFYNGVVSVFDIPEDKAELIVRLAQKENLKSKSVEVNLKSEFVVSSPTKINSIVSSVHHPQMLLKKTPPNRDMPMYRRKSLQHFLEKRKERLTSASPYTCQS